jgi:hypothetical protein
MTRISALFLLLALTAPAAAQDLEPICADRPGKGNAPCTVAPGHVQLELGFDDLSIQHRSGITTSVNDVGGLLAKFGLTDNLDVEAGVNLYQSEREHGTSLTETKTGMGDLFLHMKYGVESGHFALALNPYVKLPVATGTVGNGKLEGGLVVPKAYELGSGWALGDTLAADASGTGMHPNVSEVLGIGKRVTDDLTLGAEFWTDQNFDPSSFSAQYSVGLELADLLNNDTQIDCGVNFGLDRQTPDLEIYAGIAERF